MWSPLSRSRESGELAPPADELLSTPVASNNASSFITLIFLRNRAGPPRAIARLSMPVGGDYVGGDIVIMKGR